MSITLTSPLKKSLEKLLPTGQGSATSVAQNISSILVAHCKNTQSIISELDSNLSLLEAQKALCSEAIAILEEAAGLTVRARRFMDTPQDAVKYRDKTKEFEVLFSHALEKLDTLVKNAYTDGVNLLAGESLPTKLDVNGQTTITTQGISLTPAALDIRPPNFETMMTLQTGRIDAMNAIDMAVTLRNIINADIETLQIRKDLAESYIDMGELAQSKLDQADNLNEPNKLTELSKHAALSTEPLAETEQQEILMNFASSAPMEAKE